MKKIRNKKGFTLLELMIVVAILGVLASLAYPSFQYTLANNRAKTAASELNKAFSYARSEAISRNRHIVLCAVDSGDDEMCATSPTDCKINGYPVLNPSKNCAWTNGFMVYEDKDPSDGGFNKGVDEIIQHYYIGHTPVIIALNNTLSFTWKSGGLAVRSDRGAANDTITIIPTNDMQQDKLKRECSVSKTGRLLCE